MQYIIGLDLGTTCVKALLFDENGCILSDASEDDELFTPHQGWVEQNAEHWVELSAKVIRKAVIEAGIDANAIAALSISSQGITSVPVDQAFRPLRSAINWLDQRAVKEIEQVRSLRSDDEIYRITGKSLALGYTLPVILWLRNHEPEILSLAYKILLPHDYLCARFTGVPVTDHTMAGGTMLYDVKNQCWSDELLGIFELNRELLPEVRWAGTPVGTLTNEASQLLGIPGTVLVVTGGQDQKIAAYGAQLQMGSATISLGTCAAMEFLFDHPPLHPTRGLAAFSYLEPNSWVLEACVSTAGAALKWARDILFPELSYDGMNELAKQCETSGGVLFYPYLQGSGTPHNTAACGVITGLTLGTGKSELARAIFEGIAMEVFTNLRSAEDAGVSVGEICVFGGGSQSALLNQMLADVTGRVIRTFTTSEMGAYGAAKLAAKAVGLKDFAISVGAHWEPNTTLSARYSEQYWTYQKNLQSIFGLK